MICARHLRWLPCLNASQLHAPYEPCEELDSPVIDRAMQGFHGGYVDKDELLAVIQRERNNLQQKVAFERVLVESSLLDPQSFMYVPVPGPRRRVWKS